MFQRIHGFFNSKTELSYLKKFGITWWLSLLTAISLLIGSVFLFLNKTAFFLFCANDLYTKQYAKCSEYYKNFGSEGAWAAFLIAFFSIVTIYVLNRNLVKKLLKFILVAAPVLALLLILGATFRACIMWSCSSLLNIALRVAISILVSGSIALALSCLFRGKAAAFFLFFFALLLSDYAFTTLIPKDLFQATDNKFAEQARLKDDPAICNRINFVRIKEDCFWKVGVAAGSEETCKLIQNRTKETECLAYITRNKAVENLDIESCNEIPLPDQKAVCKKLINERLQNQRNH